MRSNIILFVFLLFVIVIIMIIMLFIETRERNDICLYVINKTHEDIVLILNNKKNNNIPINKSFIESIDSTEYCILSDFRNGFEKLISKNIDSCFYFFIYRGNFKLEIQYPDLKKFYMYNLKQLDSLNWIVVIDKLE